MRARSLLHVDPARIAGGVQSESDILLVSLSAAGSPDRGAAASTVSAAHGAGRAVAVLVNHPRTQLLRADLDAIVAPGLGAVLIAHASEPQDVRDAAVLLREFEYTRGIEPGTVAVFPVIATARALLRCAEIAAAAPRVRGLVFDGAGYASDIGARAEETGPRLAFARGQVVAAARACDGLPLVANGALDFSEMARWGFGGAVVTTEGAARAANAAFQPGSVAVQRARAHLVAYAAARAEGAWVARLAGEVVDAAAARKARLVLAQAGVPAEDATVVVPKPSPALQ